MPEMLQTKAGDTPKDKLRDEYERQSALFDAQPVIVQRFLEAQAQQIAQAYVQRARTLRFRLPDKVVMEAGGNSTPVNPTVREQHIGTLRDRLGRHDIHVTLRQRLVQLDQSNDQSIVVCADLIRYASATHMIRNMLPSGRGVKYAAIDDDDIPSIPVENESSPQSAITAETDAIVEESDIEAGRGTLQVPFIAAARKFFLPQWVAFDDQDNLLVNSVTDAEAHISSMQRFLTILFAARSLAPYMVADEEYDKKHYGMLGQLVNQGRALARYKTLNIIDTIRARAKAQTLNRGLSLSLPYFDDQDLRIETYDFVIIPAGRIMFIPAFIVRAALEERAKVVQDTRYSHGTREHLMAELQTLEEAFDISNE